MRGGTGGMRDTRYKRRGIDLTTLVNTAADNEESLERLRRALRSARAEALTARQSEVLRMHFEEGLRVSDIARALGVNRSTVSRTIVRAQKRLYDRLRYTR